MKLCNGKQSRILIKTHQRIPVEQVTPNTCVQAMKALNLLTLNYYKLFCIHH